MLDNHKNEDTYSVPLSFWNMPLLKEILCVKEWDM